MDNIVTTIARNTVNLETLFAQGLTLGPHAIESFLRDSQSHLETIRGESTQIITFYNYAQHLLSESGMSIDALKKAPQDTITDENVRVAKQYLVLDYRIRINELYRELGKTTIDNDRLLYSLYNLTLNLDNIAHGYIYDLDASPPFIGAQSIRGSISLFLVRLETLGLSDIDITQLKTRLETLLAQTPDEGPISD